MRPRLVASLAALTLMAGGVTACAYNESLGRSQFLITDNAGLRQQSEAAWAEALRTQRVSTNAAQNTRVRSVGDRLVRAAGLTNLTWDYAVFEGTSPNAFVLPSGHIGVTTALLSLASNDDQLATVIGHEIGHVVAQHAAERYSNTSLLQGGLQIAQGVAGDRAQAVGSLGSLGAQFGVLLPFSRRDELEADRLGIDYMVRAGFDPNQAIALWRKMADQRQTQTPQFASTHPSDATRIAELERYIASRSGE